MEQLLCKLSELYEDEAWAPEGSFECIDLRSLEGTRCYCDRDAEKAICERFSSLPLNALHWIDGGDYHYLTALWLRFLKEPAQLVLFDHHPDNQAPALAPDILSCGGWMLEAERNPMVREDAPSVYLSIDLDVLSRDYARTNWDHGEMSLEGLIAEIGRCLNVKTLAGVDICGGITLEQGATAEDLAVNRRTRRILENYFCGLK